jgi:hypothetical protein
LSYRIRPDFLAEFSGPVPSWTVDRIQNLGDAAIMDPSIVAARNRQTKLILENTLAAARDSIRSAADLVQRRGDATLDTFLRHHLFSTAREVAAIEGVLEASLWQDEPGPPCLVRTLISEISKLERLHAGRIGPIDRQITSLNFIPSWTSEIIFRLLARAIIYDAFVNAPRQKRLSLRLWLDGATLRFSIEGQGYCTEQSLMLRIDRPRHFKLLLESLNGSLRGTPGGISICFPVVALA